MAEALHIVEGSDRETSALALRRKCPETIKSRLWQREEDLLVLHETDGV